MTENEIGKWIVDAAVQIHRERGLLAAAGLSAEFQ